MRPLGDKRTKTLVQGHQECGTCHPPIKNRKAKEKRKAKSEAALEAAEALENA